MTPGAKPLLDSVFAALSDPTRRGILAALAVGPRAVSDLARPFEMTLPGFIKHVRILEQAGLLHRHKEGRVVHCSLSAGPMEEAATWLETYRSFWDERLAALSRYLDAEHNQEQQAWSTSSKNRPSRSSAGSTRRRRRSGKPGPTRR